MRTSGGSTAAHRGLRANATRDGIAGSRADMLWNCNASLSSAKR
nr:MAG TPA: hypothetical protein [Caudoviricetes sp.]